MNPARFSVTTRRTIIVISLLVLSGCAWAKLMTTRLEKPTFTYTGSELVEASQSRAMVNFLFSAHNPNEAGLKNVNVSYELSVEGKKFLTGNDIPLELKPKGDTDIKVPAVIAYRDLAPVLGSVVVRILSGRKTIPVTIDAVLSGKPAIYSEAGKDKLITFEMRLTKTADIPLPRGGRN
jgi:LEA14-like dessication related protein